MLDRIHPRHVRAAARTTSALHGPSGWLSVRNAAARVGVTQHRIRELVLEGKLRALDASPRRIDRWRVSARDLENWDLTHRLRHGAATAAFL